MQPYFIPYIGYWQLINAVDKYVVYDDVNFIKQGWVNRNRILINGEPSFFNIPMLGMSPNKLINQIKVNQDKTLLGKNIRKIQGAYRKAPFYLDIYPLIGNILNCKKENLAEYITESIYIICDYLDIKTELIISSSIKKENNLKGQDKIFEICDILNATEYYNAIGGRDLYSSEKFKERNINLKFLQTGQIQYHQFGNEFQPDLSILDVLMFNSRQTVKGFLKECTLTNQ